MKKYFPIIAIAIVLILLVGYLKSKKPKKQLLTKEDDTKTGKPEKSPLKNVAEAIDPIKSIAGGVGIIKPKQTVLNPTVTVSGANSSAMRPIVKPLTVSSASIKQQLVKPQFPNVIKKGNPFTKKQLDKMRIKRIMF